MKTGMSSRSSSSSSSSSSTSTSTNSNVKSHYLGTTSDIDADAMGNDDSDSDRDTNRSASSIPETGPGSGLRMGPLHGQSQSQSKKDIRLLNSPSPSSSTGPDNGMDTDADSSTDLSSNSTQSFQPSKTKVNRFGFGQKDIASERNKKGAAASKPSTGLSLSSTWANLDDFPTIMESIKAPVLSLSSSFYAYMCTPKKAPVRSPVKPSSLKEFVGSGNTQIRNDSVSALIEDLA